MALYTLVTPYTFSAEDIFEMLTGTIGAEDTNGFVELRIGEDRYLAIGAYLEDALTDPATYDPNRNGLPYPIDVLRDPPRARPIEQRDGPFLAGGDGLVAAQRAGRRRHRRNRMRTLGASAPSTIILARPPLPLLVVGRPGGHGLLGAMPRSYQVTPGIL